MKAKTPSNLEKVLAARHLAVTSECGPPRGSDREIILKKGKILKGYVDAVNVTDNQTAIVRTCSLAACIHLKLMGIDPVLQMVTRDRNRIALQSDILGAASFDIYNILCLSGDHQSFGDHPQAQNVYDLDSIHLLETACKMRDEGRFLSGAEIKHPPKMFVGAVENPFAEPFELRVMRLAKKVAAGAEFIQTQCVYNVDKFEEWMRQTRDRGLTEKIYIMAGITPLKSVGMAKHMKNKVPGMDVPDEIINRISDAPREKQSEVGLEICIETIQRLKECKGISGFHIMAIEWEEIVPELVKRAGLFPRPQFS